MTSTPSLLAPTPAPRVVATTVPQFPRALNSEIFLEYGIASSAETPNLIPDPIGNHFMTMHKRMTILWHFQII